MNLTVIKTIFFSLFFLFFFQFAKGQELLNPLLDSLSVVSSESEKSRISLKIALELYNTDWERSQYYLDVAEESALVSEDPKAYADFSKIVGDIFHEKQALDISLKYYLKAYNVNSNHFKLFFKVSFKERTVGSFFSSAFSFFQFV